MSTTFVPCERRASTHQRSCCERVVLGHHVLWPVFVDSAMATRMGEARAFGRGRAMNRRRTRHEARCGKMLRVMSWPEFGQKGLDVLDRMG